MLLRSLSYQGDFRGRCGTISRPLAILLRYAYHGDMPLLANTRAGSSLAAWSMSLPDWDALKSCYRNLGLSAGCCGAPVVPVTSKLGWLFFRHVSGSDCSHGETAEHIIAKTIVARAAESLGCTVATEFSGPNDAWRADVMAAHPKGLWRTALEIQLSPCTLEDLEERQERYANDGVRGAWFVGRTFPDHRASHALPLFRLVFGRTAGRIAPRVRLGGAGSPQSALDLADFTARLLTRRVVFSQPPSRTQEFSAVAMAGRCWRCHRDILVLHGFTNLTHAVFAPRGWLRAQDLSKIPDAHRHYRQAIGTLSRAAPALTILRPRRLRAGSESFPEVELQAYCPECDAQQRWNDLPSERGDPWCGPAALCWTLKGEAWQPNDRTQPRWSVLPGDRL